MISRRTLLQGVGSAGGLPAAIATLAALRGLPATAAHAAAPALPRGDRRVIVIGGGIAGLVAALEMQRAGWSVRVLEAADRAGGRCLTLRAGDVVREAEASPQRVTWDGAPHLYFNPGPARIPHHHRGILGYCKALGVPLEVQVNENRAALLQASTGPMPQRRVHADLRGLIAELAAKGLERGTLDAPLGEADLESLRAMLRRFGALGQDHRYHGTSRAGWDIAPAAGPDPPRALPPLDPRLLLEPTLWAGAAFTEGIDYAATMLQPVGGMDRIATALAVALGDALVLGAEVQSLHRTEAGARVRWRSADGPQEETTAQVLITLPAPLLARLDTDLPAERRAGLAALHYSSAAKLAFQCDRRFWEDDHAIYGGISWTPADATQIWYPSHGFHAARGILTGAYIWENDAGERFAARTPAERAAAIAADGAALHPGLAHEVAAPVSVAWSRMPRAGGAWAEWTAAQRRDLYPLLRAPEGPYHFAGEYLSWLTGWQEGAVLSAWNALEGMA